MPPPVLAKLLAIVHSERSPRLNWKFTPPPDSNASLLEITHPMNVGSRSLPVSPTTSMPPPELLAELLEMVQSIMRRLELIR